MPLQTSIPPARDGETPSGLGSLDALAEALAHPGRRRLLAHLDGVDEASIESLARRRVADAADEGAARRRLRRIHLPKLEAADLVECDYREGIVVPTTTLDCLLAPVGPCCGAADAPEEAEEPPSQ